MKTFTDSKKRAWEVVIDPTAVKRVRGLVKVDLLETLDGNLMQKLAADPVLLCDVLYALCKDECEAKGVSDVEFGTGLVGDAIDRATAALLEELTDFFPASRRPALKAALVKIREIEKRGGEIALAGIQSPEMAAKIEKELTAPLSEFLSTHSPASSESIPGT